MSTCRPEQLKSNHLHIRTTFTLFPSLILKIIQLYFSYPRRHYLSFQYVSFEHPMKVNQKRVTCTTLEDCESSTTVRSPYMAGQLCYKTEYKDGTVSYSETFDPDEQDTNGPLTYLRHRFRPW